MNKHGLFFMCGLIVMASGCVTMSDKDTDCGMYDFECKSPEDALIDMQKIRQEIAQTRVDMQDQDRESVDQLTDQLRVMQEKLDRMEKLLQEMNNHR